MPSGFEVRGTTGRELMRQLVGHNLGLVLNPANRYGKEFLVAETAVALLGGHTLDVTIGEPGAPLLTAPVPPFLAGV